jgi:hypothetical protein
MFDTFEAVWTFLIPLSPRPAVNAGRRSPLLTAKVSSAMLRESTGQGASLR